MADKPILFSAPMVRALLDGKKTQTRRIIKPQPYNSEGDCVDISVATAARYCKGADGRMYFAFDHPRGGPLTAYVSQKNIGDRLWVREAHAIVPRTAYRMSIGTGTVAQQEHPTDDYSAALFREGFDRSGRPLWKPSIHMPRWASRLTLIVEDVKVERLHDIIEEDAIAEGCIPDDASLNPNCIGPAKSIYAGLWDSINGPCAWEANPWVAVYLFRVIKSNIDKIGGAA